MKNNLIAAGLLLTLTACAGTAAPKSPGQTTPLAAVEPVPETNVPRIEVVQVGSIDSSVEVKYRCASPGGSQNISAMYGIKDGTIVAAQLKINEQVSPGLWRVTNDANGDTQNSFYGSGLTWITEKATPATVRRTVPKQLLQAQSLDANGAPTGTQDILLKDCSVVQGAADNNRRTRRR